jgi:hypothetical protein
LAKSVTRLFSNDVSADWLVGVSPSLASVSKAERIAASSPTVVPEDSSIFRTSLCSVARALETALLDDEELLVLELLELSELLVLPLEVLAAAVAVDVVPVEDVPVVDVGVEVSEWWVCTRAATWCATWACDGVMRPSRVSHVGVTLRARLGRRGRIPA